MYTEGRLRRQKMEIPAEMLNALARRLLVASILTFAVWAQVAPTEPAAGSIAGVVRDDLTHAPLADVPVSAGGVTGTTDLQGRFVFQHIAPGRHWISVYDERRALSSGVYAVVGAGQEVVGVESRVKPGGAISGKVVDRDQKPWPGVSVLLLEKKFEFGQLAYDRQLTATTGDSGEYRLEPVRAERSYVIFAKKPLAVSAPEAELSADAERERILVPTFYPNSLDAQGAAPVILAPEESRAGVDIKMADADSYCMDGTLEASGGAPPDSLAITEHLALLTGSTFAPVTIKVTSA